MDWPLAGERVAKPDSVNCSEAIGAAKDHSFRGKSLAPACQG